MAGPEDDKRAAAKLDLIQKLAERKLDEEDAGLWYRLLDWLLPLSDELARALGGELRRLAQEQAMPFVPQLVREGIEEGLREGLQKGLTAVVKARFPNDADAFLAEVGGVSELDKLDRALQAAPTATLDELRQLLS